MEASLRELMQRVRDVKRDGVLGVELLSAWWSGHRVAVERGRIEERTTPSGESVTARVWLEGGRAGQAEGSVEQLDSLFEAAIGKADAAAPDAFAGPVARLEPAPMGLGTDDRRYGAIEDDDRDDVVQTAERAARAVDRRIVPGRFWYEDTRKLRRFVSSKGLSMEEYSTVYRAGGLVTCAGEKDGVSRSIEARTFASIASLPFGTDASRIAIETVKKGDTVDGETRVLLWPYAVAQIVALLADSWSQQAIDEGRLFLGAASDEPVLDPRIHILDDGVLPGGMRSSGFDDRGVLPVPLVLLREGRVSRGYETLARARELGTRPTGSEVGGRLRPRNLALRSGTRSVNATLTDRDSWVLSIAQLVDVSGIDLSTGEVDLTVSGAVYKGPKAVGSVRNRRLTGNLRDALNAVEEVCSNTDRVGHVDAPAIIVNGLTLA